TLSHATFAAEDCGNLFSQDKVGIDARYRYEHVDQDNALDNAEAQTLRTRLTLQSGKWYGLSALDDYLKSGELPTLASARSPKRALRPDGLFRPIRRSLESAAPAGSRRFLRCCTVARAEALVRL